MKSLLMGVMSLWNILQK